MAFFCTKRNMDVKLHNFFFSKWYEKIKINFKHYGKKKIKFFKKKLTELRKIGKYSNHLFMRQSLDSRERQVELVLMCFQHIENVWHLQASPCRYCQPWQRINQRFMGWKVIQQAKGLCMRDPCGTTYLLRSYFVSDRIGKPGSALFFMMDFCCETGGWFSSLFKRKKS